MGKSSRVLSCDYLGFTGIDEPRTRLVGHPQDFDRLRPLILFRDAKAESRRKISGRKLLTDKQAVADAAL